MHEAQRWKKKQYGGIPTYGATDEAFLNQVNVLRVGGKSVTLVRRFLRVANIFLCRNLFSKTGL